jgi:hypothetical protein
VASDENKDLPWLHPNKRCSRRRGHGISWPERTRLVCTPRYQKQPTYKQMRRHVRSSQGCDRVRERGRQSRSQIARRDDVRTDERVPLPELPYEYRDELVHERWMRFIRICRTEERCDESCHDAVRERRREGGRGARPDTASPSSLYKYRYSASNGATRQCLVAQRVRDTQHSESAAVTRRSRRRCEWPA